ncbi:hypothetical protein [Methanosarcina sp. UBA5]|uniref:hypothetical protein n=1 Tax=Methanosarcina sp. UBA5 TaxID=1915593 RepID=UPI0025FEE1B6|nr:hypothetical protein [Methanosarcina sp. UBA5]
MITTASVKNRLKTLEQGPDVQESKIFFIDGGSDEALTKAQWEAVTAWQRTHPWGQAHVIVCEEVGPGRCIHNNKSV